MHEKTLSSNLIRSGSGQSGPVHFIQAAAIEGAGWTVMHPESELPIEVIV